MRKGANCLFLEICAASIAAELHGESSHRKHLAFTHFHISTKHQVFSQTSSGRVMHSFGFSGQGSLRQTAAKLEPRLVSYSLLSVTCANVFSQVQKRFPPTCDACITKLYSAQVILLIDNRTRTRRLSWLAQGHRIGDPFQLG